MAKKIYTWKRYMNTGRKHLYKNGEFVIDLGSSQPAAVAVTKELNTQAARIKELEAENAKLREQLTEVMALLDKWYPSKDES